MPIVRRYPLEAAPLLSLKLGCIYVVDDLETGRKPFEALYCGAETIRHGITYLLFFDLRTHGLYEIPSDGPDRFCVYFSEYRWREKVS